MAQVVIRNLNKKFDGVHAVNDVNLQVRDKEFMVLVGPSGCGKTTTLRMVAGLETITSGDVLIGDKVVNELAPMDRDIAMVFQNYALYPHMSVYDNMAFGLKMRKFAKPDIAKRVQDAAEILGIQGLLARKPRQLSGGQRQRVTLGDRVVVMKDGWVQQVGEPLELYNEPANRFVAGFLGSPAMNFFNVTVAENNGALWVANPGFRLQVPDLCAGKLRAHVGGELWLGIRPEDLRVAAGADGSQMRFDVVVEVVERLGSETLLDVKAGPCAMVAAVEADIHAKIRDRLRLLPNPERLHFFDIKTEAAI